MRQTNTDLPMIIDPFHSIQFPVIIVEIPTVPPPPPTPTLSLSLDTKCLHYRTTRHNSTPSFGGQKIQFAVHGWHAECASAISALAMVSRLDQRPGTNVTATGQGYI